MAKLKPTSNWWTSPTEGDDGSLIIVTGRADMEQFMSCGAYNDRIEVTWTYNPDRQGLPDLETSKLMEEITDALNKEFDKDPVAIMTGIYTGGGKRNFIFYSRSNIIFERKFNKILSKYELLSISIYAEKDPDWAEYKEMKESTEILEDESSDSEI